MSTPHRPDPSERDRSILRLRRLTFGIAIGGLAGSGALGALAAQSYHASVATDEVAIVSTNSGDVELAISAKSPSASTSLLASVDPPSGAVAAPAAATPTPTPAPVAATPPTRVAGGGHVTTGGS